MKYPAGGSASLYSSSLCSQSNVEVAVHDLSNRRACPKKIAVTFALLPGAGNDPIARWKHTAGREKDCLDTNRNAFDVSPIKGRLCSITVLCSQSHNISSSYLSNTEGARS